MIPSKTLSAYLLVVYSKDTRERFDRLKAFYKIEEDEEVLKQLLDQVKA